MRGEPRECAHPFLLITRSKRAPPGPSSLNSTMTSQDHRIQASRGAFGHGTRLWPSARRQSTRPREMENMRCSELHTPRWRTLTCRLDTGGGTSRFSETNSRCSPYQTSSESPLKQAGGGGKHRTRILLDGRGSDGFQLKTAYNARELVKDLSQAGTEVSHLLKDRGKDINPRTGRITTAKGLKRHEPARLDPSRQGAAAHASHCASCLQGRAIACCVHSIPRVGPDQFCKDPLDWKDCLAVLHALVQKCMPLIVKSELRKTLPEAPRGRINPDLLLFAGKRSISYSARPDPLSTNLLV
jgi:hypothetical protein